MDTLQHAIRKYRRSRRLSQGQLGAQWGVGQQTISYWERGKSFPSDAHSPIVAAALKMPLSEFLEFRLLGSTDPNRAYSKGDPRTAAKLADALDRLTLVEEELAALRATCERVTRALRA